MTDMGNDGVFAKDCNDTTNALYICQGYHIGTCPNCPFYNAEIDGFECHKRMIHHAIDLIRNQQKTIKDLSEKIAYWQAEHTKAQLGELIEEERADDKARMAEEAYRRLHEIAEGKQDEFRNTALKLIAETPAKICDILEM